MKKICNVLVLALVLVGLFLITCNMASAETSSKTDSSNTSAAQVEYSFQAIENIASNEVLKTYWNAVYDRVWEAGRGGAYLTADEHNYLLDKGFHLYDFEGRYIGKFDSRTGSFRMSYFPVVFEGQNGIELWFTDDSGNLQMKAIEGKLTNNRTWDLFEDAHHTLDQNETILTQNAFFQTVYDSTTGCISVWEFGQKIREHFVPKNSIYAGFSSVEGFIFRSGSDVYAVRDYRCDKMKFGVEVIAHNVEFVIDADYEADNPDEFSQPLFLMKDGSVMCYCTFYSEDGIPVDDERHLIQIRFEMGFNI